MPAERAGYTVTMFLIDVSSSMGRTREVELPDGPRGEKRSRETTNLEWAMQFVLLKIQEMIFNGRKTDQCGVIVFGTEDTNNIINDTNGGYEHVTEYIPIGQPNASTLQKLQKLQPSEVTGDPIDAIIVGIETQDSYLGKKKTWTRRMVLVTDAETPIEMDEWEMTASKMNSLDIIMTIVGIDFDDEEIGYEEEDKSDVKRENEKFYHSFTSRLTNGVLGTAAYALQECVRPEVRLTKSALMGHVLRLGDVDTRSEEAVEVMVRTSKCTALARPPALKKFARRVGEIGRGDGMDVDEEGNEGEREERERMDVYVELQMRTEYYIYHQKDKDGEDREGKQKKKGGQDEDDDDAETIDEEDEEEGVGEKGERVDREELVRGFKYGSSYVPCPEGQFERLETRKGMDICGFFSDANIRRDWFMTEIQYVWADPSSGQQQTAFSSIVQAMLAREVVAIARWVNRDGADPKMGILVPRAFEEVDCFLWCQLPFADDIRKYTFPSLEDVITTKGEKLAKHPYIPTDEQMEAMENFVDAMDLMQAGEKDEEGNRQPWFDPRYSYNPAVHRLKQALFHAAVVGDLKTNPVPPPHPEITKYLDPPRRVLKRADKAIEECKRVFKVKDVPKKVTRKRKDGHVHADDDDDEELLLDKKPAKGQSIVASSQKPKSQKEKAIQLQTPPATKKTTKKDKMDVDGDNSATEPESDVENDVEEEASTSKPKTTTKGQPLPTPARTPSPSGPPDSEYAEDADLIDHDEDPDAESLPLQQRIISLEHPLKDFQKNIKRGDIVTKAVEDFAWVIKEVVMKPFARRRHGEMMECMRELRETCSQEDEIEAWNAFLQDLKASCNQTTGINNREFWDLVKEEGRTMSLISGEEAKKLGGVSNVSEDEAVQFMK